MWAYLALSACAVAAFPGIATASVTQLTTVPGTVADATPDRVLYRPAAGSTPFKVRDVASGTDTIVPVRAGRVVGSPYARLFDGGVLFATTAAGGSDASVEIDEWKTGATASTGLGSLNSSSSIVVAGDYAIWSGGTQGRTLTRRGLAADVNVVVSTNAGNTDNDVAANGDVAYWDTSYEVHRWRAGVDTQLSSSLDTYWSTYPRTDGTLIVYRTTPSQQAEYAGLVAFSDGATETTLPGSERPGSETSPQADSDYRVSGGWIAYAGPSRTQILTRDPSGAISDVSADGEPGGKVSLLGLAPSGQVMYNRGGATFLGAPGQHPLTLGSSESRSFWNNNRWYLIRNGALLRLDTDTAITARPPAATQATTAHFTLASTARQPTYACTLDNAPVQCDGGEYTASSLSEGGHTFTAGATDTALAETDATPATATWIVDHTPPSDFALGDPGNGAAVNAAQLSWSPATDPGGSGVVSYAVTIDGQPAGSTTGVTTFTAGALSDGAHTWRVRAVDAAGNTRDSETRSFTLDTVPPSEPAPVAPADGAAVSSSRPTLAWTGSSDTGTGLAGYDVEIDGAATRVGSDATSFAPSADLPDGVHVWRVVAVDAAGNRTAGAVRTFRVDTRPPTAKLTASPNPALTGWTVHFDAGGSVPSAAALTHYEWDLDGNGTYETDTGAAATAQRTYGAPQKIEVRVRVTDAAGRSGTAHRTLSVTPAPPSGPPGVSINGGARFTNDPAVTLSARWPWFATRMLVSNDGGFDGAQPQPVAAQVTWLLDSSGAERLPKTVYVRYLGGQAGNETYQDDIILDETPPVLQQAVISGPQFGRRLTAAKKTPFVLKLKASDKVSGVAKMQVARDKKHPPAWERFRNRKPLTSSHAVWVRVRDSAGNRSSWRRAQLH